MTKEQDNYMEMFLTFENTVTTNEATLVKWPEILAARDSISTKKGTITGLAIIQQNGSASEANFKKTIRAALNTDFATVVKAIEGNIAGDAKLQGRYANIMPSDLKNTRDTEVEADILAVIADATEILPKLLERTDVTEAKLQEMTVLAANYTKSIGEKGTAEDLAVQATADLDAIFNEINNELRELNNVIKGMPDSVAPLRSALQLARKVGQ